MEAEIGCDDGVAGTKNENITCWSYMTRKQNLLDFCKQNIVIANYFAVCKFLHSWSHSGYHSQPCASDRMGILSLMNRWRNLAQSLNDLSKLVRKELDLEFSLFWSNPWCSSRITPHFPLSSHVPDSALEVWIHAVGFTSMINTSRNLNSTIGKLFSQLWLIVSFSPAFEFA